jgi:hypothetical protein
MLSGHMTPESTPVAGTGQANPGRPGRSGRRIAGGLGGSYGRRGGGLR